MLCFSVLMNQKVVFFSTSDANEIRRLGMSRRILESPDIIYEISVSKDYIILTTEPSGYTHQMSAQPENLNSNIRNINAYDWKGNPMWNIGEIVGDVWVPFCGGTVTTKELLDGHAGLDMSRIPDDHDLFCCTSRDSYLYVIDLDEKKLLQKVETR